MDEKSAFEKAISELGDVSALADEISMKKRQEVFSDMYMKTRNYMSTWRIILYVLCGTAIGFGIIIAMVAWLASGVVNAPFGTLMIFGGLPAIGLVYLGLTQETSTQEAMNWKRALLYVAASGLFLFGIFASFMAYFGNGRELLPAIASLIPFALPGAAFGIFLILTEKDRSKPWVIERRKEYMKYEQERFGNPAQEQRFGLISGALWIAAITGFILITMLAGIQFSWLAIVAALIGQLIVLAFFTKSK